MASLHEPVTAREWTPHFLAPLPYIANHDAPLPQCYRGSIMVLGNFDGVHVGHKALIERACKLAEERNAPLGLMSSEPHPRQFLNPAGAPFRLTSRVGKRLGFAQHGIELLYEPCFDVEFATRSPHDFASQVLNSYLGVCGVVVGRDFRFGHKRSGDVQELRTLGAAMGFSVDVVDDVTLGRTRASSTLIRAWISEGKLEDAMRALSGNWLTSASFVDEGYVLFESHQLLPPPGSYQVMVLDREGKKLGFEIVTISDSRHAHRATESVGPGSHLLSGWRRADVT